MSWGLKYLKETEVNYNHVWMMSRWVVNHTHKQYIVTSYVRKKDYLDKHVCFDTFCATKLNSISKASLIFQSAYMLFSVLLFRIWLLRIWHDTLKPRFYFKDASKSLEWIFRKLVTFPTDINNPRRTIASVYRICKQFEKHQQQCNVYSLSNFEIRRDVTRGRLRILDK